MEILTKHLYLKIKQIKNKFMKNLLIVTLVLLINGMHVQSQELIDIYKKGNVKLEEVNGYGSKNNWQTLFNDYNTVQYGSATGKHKRIVVAPDGSVFMSHRSKHEIWKFDKNGNFLKKFGKKGSRQDQFLFIPEVGGVLDGKYVFTFDNQGKVKFFDLEGNFVKMLQINYMPLEIIPLKNSKIAIVGYADRKTILVIKNYNTGKEKIILTEKDKTDDGSININMPKGGMLSWSLPLTHSSLTRYRIATSKNGNLIVASPENGIITEYSTDGVKLKEFNLNITPLKITDEDINSYYETALKNIVKFEEQLKKKKNYTETDVKNVMTQYRNQINNFKDRKYYPSHLPYFSTFIIDSESNIIVFEYTKEDVSNNFIAYTFDAKGKYVCSSSFKTDNYELNFEPYSFAINNGYVYSLAFKNNCTDYCLQLVKFKMFQKYN